MKVANLEGQALNFWVARADVNITLHTMDGKPYVLDDKPGLIPYEPSTDWAQGGPIIERERIGVVPHARQPGMWAVPLHWSDEHESVGPTPLVAAMRAFVARKFGEEVPDENLP